MNRSRKMTVGLVLLAVLAALDIVGVAGAGMHGALPWGSSSSVRSSASSRWSGSGWPGRGHPAA